jgi:hypothetical protein
VDEKKNLKYPQLQKIYINSFKKFKSHSFLLTKIPVIEARDQEERASEMEVEVLL